MKIEVINSTNDSKIVRPINLKIGEGMEFNLYGASNANKVIRLADKVYLKIYADIPNPPAFFSEASATGSDAGTRLPAGTVISITL